MKDDAPALFSRVDDDEVIAIAKEDSKPFSKTAVVIFVAVVVGVALTAIKIL